MPLTRRFLLVALLPLLAAACGGRDSGSGHGIAVVSTGADAETLFPPLAASSQSFSVVDLLYDKLADIGPGLNTIGDVGFVPRLAERWEWSKDSLSIAFHLTPKARWHDGTPVTARDVQFAWRIWSDSSVGAPMRSWLANVDSISTPDSLTARVWFKARTAEQFYSVVYVLRPLPSHRLATLTPATMKDDSIWRAPIGDGPFRFVSWTPRARLELAANDEYYGGRPSVDGIVYAVAAQGATVAARLVAGDADFLEALAPPDFAQIATAKDVVAQETKSFDYSYLAFNFADPSAKGRPHPLFADRALRRALTMAVDRPLLVKGVFDSLGVPARGPFSRTQWTADSTLQSIPVNRAAAEALLDSLGWTKGKDGVRARNGRRLAFAVLTPSSSRTRQAAAVILQAQLKEVGVDMSIDGVDFNTFMSKSDAGKFDALIGGIRTTASPRGVRELWTSTGPRNAGHWANASFDAQVDSALAAMDAGTVRAHFRAAYQIAIDDAPAIWLYEPRAFAGRNRRLTTGTLRPDAWWASASNWTIDPAMRLPRDRRAPTP